MKLLMMIGIAVCAIGSAGATQDYDEQTTKAHCATEWQSDFAMQKYCADQIAEGYQTHLTHRETAIGLKNPQLTAAFDDCTTEWLPDWTMIAYCEGQHIEGVAKLAETLASLPEDVAQTVFSQCSEQWVNDLTMQAYCAGQQAQAWRELQ